MNQEILQGFRALALPNAQLVRSMFERQHELLMILSMLLIGPRFFEGVKNESFLVRLDGIGGRMRYFEGK